MAADSWAADADLGITEASTVPVEVIRKVPCLPPGVVAADVVASGVVEVAEEESARRTVKRE
jgi:hypothetical protein